MPETRKYVDYTGLTQYDSKLKKWVTDQLEKQKVKQVNADWNESNIESPSYIENRTHYKEPIYWTFSEAETKYGHYSIYNDSADFFDDMFIYEVSIDGGDFIEVVPSVSLMSGWTSLGNPAYNPVNPISLFNKVAEDSDMGNLDFSITNAVDAYGNNSVIFSSNDSSAHTIRIKSTKRAVPFFENHYAYMDGEIPTDSQLIEGDMYPVFINEDYDNPIELTAHSFKATSSSESMPLDGMVLGNGKLVEEGLSIVMGVQGNNIESTEYDDSIDSDEPIGILFVDFNDGTESHITGLLFSNTRDIESIVVDYIGMMEPLEVTMRNYYDFMGITPSLDPDPSELKDVTFETEPSDFRSKIFLIANSEKEGVDHFGDRVENGKNLIVTFNGENYTLRPAAPREDWLSLWYRAEIVNGTKDWGYFSVLGNSNTPFLICLYSGFNDYGFVEVLFNDDYNNQEVSLNIQYESGSDVHQLGKEYIPNPIWDEVEEKPNWVSKSDVLKIFWGDTSDIFKVEGGTLYFADDVTPSEIDYPVIIPSSLNGEEVSDFSISFSDTEVPGLYFSDGLPNTSTIGRNTPSLEEVYVDCSYVDNNAFYNDTNLKKAELSDSITYLGSSAFEGCTSLEEVNIPRGITKLNNYTFRNCSSLKSILIPKTITDNMMGSNIFAGCDNCKVTLENGMTRIPSQLFYYASIKSVNIPSTVTEIGNAAFSRSNITEINLPDSITTIGSTAFSNTKLTTVDLPENLTGVGSEVFQNCTDLKYVGGENLESVGSSTFKGCTALEEVYTGKDSLFAGYNAFDGCSSLTTIPNIDCSIYVGNYAFRGCTSLTNITLVGEGRGYVSNYIGDYAFSNCTSLTSIEIPEKIYQIKQYAFYGCTSLTSLILHEGLYRMDGYYMFSSNVPLTTLDIPSTVQMLGDGLRNLTQLTTLTVRATTPPSIYYSYSIPSSVQHIYVPAESVEAYKSASRWSDHASKIEAIQ